MIRLLLAILVFAILAVLAYAPRAGAHETSFPHRHRATVDTTENWRAGQRLPGADLRYDGWRPAPQAWYGSYGWQRLELEQRQFASPIRGMYGPQRAWTFPLIGRGMAGPNGLRIDVEFRKFGPR